MRAGLGDGVAGRRAAGPPRTSPAPRCGWSCIRRSRARGAGAALQRFGTAPLVVGAAGAGRRAARPRVPGTSHTGHLRRRPPASIIAPGADVVSDPVPLAVAARRPVAVSLHVVAAPAVVPQHPVALQTSYLSAAAISPRRRAIVAVARPDPVLARAHRPRRAARRGPSHAVVAVGDSITDGVGSARSTPTRAGPTRSPRGWPPRAARPTMAVLNAGISRQPAARRRCGARRRLAAGPVRPRTSTAAAGATDVVLNIGTNDIAAGRDAADDRSPGCRPFADRTHAAGQAGVPHDDHAVDARAARHAGRRRHPRRGERVGARRRAASTPTACSTSRPPCRPGRPAPAGPRLRRGRRAAPLGRRLPGPGRGRRSRRAHRQPVPGRRPGRPRARPLATIRADRLFGGSAGGQRAAESGSGTQAEPAQAALAAGLVELDRHGPVAGPVGVSSRSRRSITQSTASAPGRHAAFLGDPAQLLDAQRGQAQLEDLGRAEPAGELGGCSRARRARVRRGRSRGRRPRPGRRRPARARAADAGRAAAAPGTWPPAYGLSARGPSVGQRETGVGDRAATSSRSISRDPVDGP